MHVSRSCCPHGGARRRGRAGGNGRRHGQPHPGPALRQLRVSQAVAADHRQGREGAVRVGDLRRHGPLGRAARPSRVRPPLRQGRLGHPVGRLGRAGTASPRSSTTRSTAARGTTSSTPRTATTASTAGRATTRSRPTSGAVSSTAARATTYHVTTFRKHKYRFVNCEKVDYRSEAQRGGGLKPLP